MGRWVLALIFADANSVALLTISCSDGVIELSRDAPKFLGIDGFQQCRSRQYSMRKIEL